MIMIVATVLPSLNMKEEYAIARAMIKNRKLSDDLKAHTINPFVPNPHFLYPLKT